MLWWRRCVLDGYLSLASADAYVSVLAMRPSEEGTPAPQPKPSAASDFQRFITQMGGAYVPPPEV